MGIIGGFPKRALYIVGSEDDEVIYLDPHYVQQSVNKRTFIQNIQTFYCNDYLKTKRLSLDPSMAFGFYIQNLEDIDGLYKRIQNVKKKGKS